jgi:hypothetical protein
MVLRLRSQLPNDVVRSLAVLVPRNIGYADVVDIPFRVRPAHAGVVMDCQNSEHSATARLRRSAPTEATIRWIEMPLSHQALCAFAAPSPPPDGKS